MLRALVMPVLGTLAFAWVTLLVGSPVVDVGQAPRVPNLNSPAQILLHTHDCWAGKSPYGSLIPGHAVFALPGHEPRYGRSQVGFDIWLNGKPGILYGFCR